MKTFTDFKTFNNYFGTEPPLNEHIDVGIYGDTYIMQSDEVCLDYHRISLKQRIHFPKGHEYEHLNEDSVSAFFYSSPKDVNAWYIEKRFKGYYIQFSKEIISKNKHVFKRLMDFGKHEPLFLNQEEEEEIENVYKALYKHYIDNPDEQEILLAYANVLFSLVERFYKRHLQKNVQNYNATIVEFQTLLNSYYAREKEHVELPTVAYFSEILNVTPNYLGDINKKYTGLSAIDHIQAYIIEEAKLKLQKSNKPIKKIALELGFEYQTYFTRFFKSKVGVTPSSYRKQ
ncbi:helix-turn-helix domain-containing protein [Aestuariibaculum sp. M13]|uniref:helix-turn-helix domain-containing protein n=1 Tax=Aestuariibaculum sp. M13 TaxID=2967132 RepID=UPI00215A0A95|nr:helix-turn-helix domain-containing protein [Aestuariibaculum sp. M13]MCR8667416.1 helix-turn-helix domain-containing protein [Aestuariibaculum sp. M13]